MTSDPELEEMAKRTIDSNAYMTIATVDDSGHPWATPVYFGHDDYTELYWISQPETQHSRNIERRPEVAIVVFDSSVAIGAAEAVYMTARAREVTEPTVEECEVAFRPRYEGLMSLSPEELTGEAPLRLYRATVSEHWVLIRGRDPKRGRGFDRRVAVTLGTGGTT